MLFHVLITADISGIGRADKSSLPQQTLMELFVQDIPKETLEAYFIENCGNFKDIEKWYGIKCTPSGEATQISFMNDDYVGLNLDFVPSTVWRLVLTNANLGGTVPWEGLPKELKNINLSCNALEGSARLDLLPDIMQKVKLHHNMLSGSLLLEKLPQSIISLAVYRNAFTGSVNLTQIPPKCRIIDATGNMLTGGVDIRVLPASMEYLSLGYNPLSGDLHLETIPAGMREIELQNTAFSGDVVLGEMPKRFALLCIASNAALRIVDTTGEEIDDKRIKTPKFDTEN